jgi:hypothetical protein
MNDKVFIEEQFPVSKISKESYKERKAGASQTLTGLGKWWGRKPLILIRASIIGMLMPASDNPKKDRDIFLKILTMDNDGLWIRRTKSIPAKIIQANLSETKRIWRKRLPILIMNSTYLRSFVRELIAMPNETEWLEFKSNFSDPQSIGEYLSALSNSAAICKKQFGYMIWGIDDATHKISGTIFKPHQSKKGNQALESWLYPHNLFNYCFIVCLC